VDNNWADDVYFDTFKDFAIWNDVCVKETGICGLKELNWLAEPIQLKIFRLGRLQFQSTITEEDYTYNDILIPKGSKAYNIHIPAGEPLNENACTQSYDSATTFFSSESIICLCSSWLLSPVLDELLPSSSNILRFKSRYKIISVNPENRSAERYLFGSIEDDIQKYKPTSSFAAKVKQRLEKGMPIGSAFGIYLHRSR
ncbi:MAG TPA: acyltransferase domain-containing protein, partial [Clostridia bacterium]